MSLYARKAKFEELRFIATASLTADYQTLGSAFAHPIRIAGITNTHTTDILISTDGVTDHFRITANGFKLYDLVANQIIDQGFFFAEGTQLYVKTTTGTGVWVEAIYAGGNP